ncbi:MAG: D-alanine--D-alanine ligase [Bacteroidales bacterium]|nr:D-alanine--D-alanine ligase [Bacteroidales bacterium]
MKKKIAIVMGGFSGEHDISINSGTEVYKALDRDRYDPYRIVIEPREWFFLSDDGGHVPVDKNDFSIIVGGKKILFDLAFVIIHGNPGENGRLQGYFDMIGMKYTTCDFYTSVLTFNKGYCNPLVRSFGIVALAKSKLLYGGQVDTDAILAELELPVFVKPAAGGSSVGMTKVKRHEELPAAIERALGEDDQVLVEEFIEGREFGCGVIQTQDELIAFPVTEIIPIGREFFDYEAKYNGLSNEVTPAQVDQHTSQLMQDTAKKLYRMLNCRGIVRFDFIYNEKKEKLYFLEINTIPGQSAESIVPKQARAMGISTSQLYTMLIESFL